MGAFVREAWTAFRGQFSQRDGTSDQFNRLDGLYWPAAVNYYGDIKTHIEDPVQLNVSATRSTISWTATSSSRCQLDSQGLPRHQWDVLLCFDTDMVYP